MTNSNVSKGSGKLNSVKGLENSIHSVIMAGRTETTFKMKHI